MPVFDPVLLKTFVAVAETLSFTQAAARLGISQPTISQHIRKLELAAGRNLVLRDTRAVSLSDTARVSRSTRLRPAASSSLRMCWLIVGWLIPSRAAAWVKLRVSATATKVFSSTGSNTGIPVVITIRDELYSSDSPMI